MELYFEYHWLKLPSHAKAFTHEFDDNSKVRIQQASERYL